MGACVLFLLGQVRGYRVRGVYRFIFGTIVGDLELKVIGGGWDSTYVASFPAYFRMILLPPETGLVRYQHP